MQRPKSVAEITADNCAYQDGSDQEDQQDDDDDEDTYLNDALNEDQNVDSINIAAVHLN